MNDDKSQIFFILIIMLIVALALFVLDKQCNTNNELSLNNKNMFVYVDDLTGCQYLRTYKGGITPRLNKDGKQICEVKNVEI